MVTLEFILNKVTSLKIFREKIGGNRENQVFQLRFLLPQCLPWLQHSKKKLKKEDGKTN